MARRNIGETMIYWQDLLNGTYLTIVLMLCSLLAGGIIAFIMTLASLSKKFYFTWPTETFTFFIRGTPLLVQIFLIYYGLAQFQWIQNSFLWVLLREPFFCAVLALALNTAAYTCVLFKGALEQVPQAEIEAGKALALSSMTIFIYITFPRALRAALPAYSNEVIMILKGTTLASTITLLELTGVMRKLIAQTYQTTEFFVIAALIYLVLTALIVGLFKWWEHRLKLA